jgi:hypothetical protein
MAGALHGPIGSGGVISVLQDIISVLGDDFCIKLKPYSFVLLLPASGIIARCNGVIFCL